MMTNSSDLRVGSKSTPVVCNQKLALLFVSMAITGLLTSGCSLLFGLGGSDPTPTPGAERVIVPTFTPTTPGDQASQLSPNEVAAVAPAANEGAPSATQVAAPVEPAPEADEPAQEEEPPTEESAPEPPTATPVPKLIVQIAAANVRNGPGTEYGLAGSVTQNQAFDIVAKNADGTWWLFCCVNGQEVWIFGDLVTTENAGEVQVAQNIPAPPPVAAAPAAPAPESQPAPQEPESQPPPAADPCAGIGGDGCKFKVRDGPKFNANGGQEIKLQLLFIHSGIDGGQPQSSYFVVMLKDGVKLPIGDNVRSFGPDTGEGVLGRYNYEYKIGLGDIPGNTVAGNYTMYVLDGNGERDSQDLNFTIPEGQGEVWVVWDQG